MKKIFSFGLALSTLLTLNLVNPTKNSVCLAALSDLDSINPEEFVKKIANQISIFRNRSLPEEKEKLVVFENLYTELDNILENPSIPNSEKILKFIMIMSSLMERLLEELREIYPAYSDFVNVFVDEVYYRLSCFNDFSYFFSDTSASLDKLKLCTELIPEGKTASCIKRLISNLKSEIIEILKAKRCPATLVKSELCCSNEEFQTNIRISNANFTRRFKETDEFNIKPTDINEPSIRKNVEKELTELKGKIHKMIHDNAYVFKNFYDRASSIEEKKQVEDFYESSKEEISKFECSERDKIIKSNFEKSYKQKSNFLIALIERLKDVEKSSLTKNNALNFGKRVGTMSLLYKNLSYFGEEKSKEIEENFKKLPEAILEIINKNSPEESQEKAIKLFSSLDPKNLIEFYDIINTVLPNSY